MSGWRDHYGTSSTERGYGTDWEHLRAQVLAEEPDCRSCGALASHADHIEPVSKRPDLRLERANIQALCARCHRAKTAREGAAARGRRESRKRAPEPHPGLLR